MAEIASHAEVTTDKPVAYMRQLCKHFGHKTDASFGEDTGYIQFEFGRCELRAVDGTLRLAATASDDEQHERVEKVVGSHLERFGKRDGLSVSWQG